MKNETETRFTADWVADVKVETGGITHIPTRKVLTKSTKQIQLSKSQAVNIADSLQKGCEVRLTAFGKEAIRLYPCLDKDYKAMFVAAQSMGDFRSGTYNGIKFKIAKRHRKSERDWTPEDFRELSKKTNKERNRRIYHSVTPDTMVTCPECGFEFRVGKPMG